MTPLRTYIDTSVLGGYFDRLFESDTRVFVRCIRERKIVPVVSDMVIGEIARAPERVQELLSEMLRQNAEALSATEQAVELQEAYLKNGVLSTVAVKVTRCISRWLRLPAWMLLRPGTLSIWLTRDAHASSTV